MPTLSEAVAIAGIGGTVRRNGRALHTVLADEMLATSDPDGLPALAQSMYIQDGWEVVTSAGPIPDGTRVRFTPAYGTSEASHGIGTVAWSTPADDGFTYSIATEYRGETLTASRTVNPDSPETVLRESDDEPPIFPTDVHRDVAIAAAGIGGEIEREHTRYTIGRDVHGNWTMGNSHNGQGICLATEYVPGGWSVTAIGDQPEIAVAGPIAEVVEPIAVERVARIPHTSAEALILRSQVTSALALFPVIGDDVARMLPALDTLARWLDGGKLQIAGHELARGETMCGEYESLVCPVFGWTPRRGEESSMMSQRQRFHDGLKAFEQQNAGLPAVDLLERWADMYVPGGPMNTAAVSHITDHLEEHKVPAVNELFSEFGWDHAPEEPEVREYTVMVPVTRTRVITETQLVSYTTSAASADEAIDYVRGNVDMTQHADDYSWSECDESVQDIEEGDDWEADES